MASDRFVTRHQRLDDRFIDGHFHGWMVENPGVEFSLDRMHQGVVKVWGCVLELVQGSLQIGPDGLGRHPRHRADGDEGRAQIGVTTHRPQIIAFAPPADDRADFQPGQSRHIPRLMGQRGVINRVDRLEHLEDGIHAVDILSGRMLTHDVEREIRHARMLGDHVMGAVGFGDDRDIGLVALVEEVSGAQAALQLGDDARDDEVTRQSDPRFSDGFSGVNHRRQAAFHVPAARPIELVALDPGLEGVARPARGQGVDVQMSVEHEASASPRTLQGRHRLEPSPLHFLQLHLVPPSGKIACEPAGDGGLLADEAGNANERFA